MFPLPKLVLRFGPQWNGVARWWSLLEAFFGPRGMCPHEDIGVALRKSGQVKAKVGYLK